MDDNALSFDLAKSVGAYFRLSESEMETILDEVLNAVKNWKKVAAQIGIPLKEQQLMEGAFNI